MSTTKHQIQATELFEPTNENGYPLSFVGFEKTVRVNNMFSFYV